VILSEKDTYLVQRGLATRILHETLAKVFIPTIRNS